MNSSTPPRHQGRITTWKDDQGFGFITPDGGGPTVFVHASAFGERGARPAESDIVTYQLGANGKGQPRAERVAFVRERGKPRAPSGAAPRNDAGALALSVGFLALVAVLAALGWLPSAVPWLCLGMSTIAFVAYGIDKSAARHDRRRTRESHLHLLALAGGWPGALLAQRVFRHKSSKPAFQAAFRWTVALHCAMLCWLASPYGAEVLR
ncbi:cold shock and DUF1294 domain-containing protein [uncultured Massilia sp.]|uniref:cold shock and DUF1294 domain-containing protein n=1 Tax=uncultured Massilia sp. TaxID=169973 RepID=UPI0025F7D0B5|nr:cold shock and DUF1294 domain-containing protein [uncultured Massilia sp.]